ncbi:OmpA family protein [Pseudaminobacter arsenicus]|uniref:OmpA family protein n=1 Tax=Borborobacter arsenicus TaxID=1851146 RepID=A0A432V419_9HYPH|nr:OmpA family protein [Pseudaminobacter arsenicus]RUM96983.1 OmpA family protein [Pseudaminobacter arsenicus]
MKRQPRILAGTALGLLMASAPLSALPLQAQDTEFSPRSQQMVARQAPLLFAQAEEQPTEEELLKRKQQQEEKAAPAEEPAPEPEAAPPPQPEPQAEPEPQPEPEEAPQSEPAPEPEAAQPEPEAAPPPPQPEPQAEPEPQPEPEAAPQPEPAPEPEAAQPEPEAAPPPQPEPQAAPEPEPDEAAPEQQPEPEAEPQPTPEVAPEPEAAPEEAPAPQAAPEAEPEAAPTPEAKPEAPAEPQAEQPAQEAPTEGEAPTPTEPPAAAPEAPAPAEGEQAPSEGAAPAAPEAPVEGEAPVEAPDGSAAPILDSQKGQPAAPQAPAAAPEGQAEGQPAEQPAAPAAPAEAAPPPTDDRAAQQEVQPAEIQPVTAEEGTRVEQKKIDLVRRERPEGTEVVKEFGDRVIIQFNNQTIVESNERPRMTRGARDVYYEDLPRGRTRETIVREDGTRVVTIRNAYGDVIRRSRIAPDDREYVLVYVEEDNYDRVRDWRDPGLDLPPLRLDIPEEEYILTSERASDPDVYYEFLEQPPVERVERLYSIDEVKRSARIRDKTRRIDLDTVTFEFGSAAIPESEISRLEGVATAMERILKDNPAETFLIEGHTDAVGSDLANLALSDKRAEAVAEALTNVFAIPPENLTTQGYGEQYLKVNTQQPERENRRVAIRRITPLVAPVASAK